MTDVVDQAKKRKPGYEPIVLPDGDTWSTNRFIDFYLRTQGYAVTASNRELVRVKVRQYDGPRPIVATALLSFLSSKALGTSTAETPRDEL